MIPKIVHYCWFGGKPLPSNLQEYVDEWHTLLPDYDFKKWDESNFDVESSVPYVRDAYAAGFYAFVADYVRMEVIHNYGGVYMDTDIKLLKSLDPFLHNSFFTSVEYHADFVRIRGVAERLDAECGRLPMYDHIPGIGIQSAIFGAVKGHPYIKACMDYYADLSYNGYDKPGNDKIILPDVMAICAEPFGFKYKDEEQHLGELTLYPQDYFTGFKTATDRTVAVHIACNTWLVRTPSQRLYNCLSKIRCLRDFINKIEKTDGPVSRLIYKIKCFVFGD